uniref:Uncharacterized protein n=1 Tax=Anopheles farauti TaxID=69004 RepID=A0A182QTH3_9DIPT
MQLKVHKLAAVVLVVLAAWVVPVPAEHVVEYYDIPNRISWLPEGTDLVLNFLLTLSGNMIRQYTLVLERIRSLREHVQSLPPAYASIDLFYDNDIQQPLDKDTLKPIEPLPGYSRDAFKSALKTIQQFAGKRIPPFVKH